MSTSASLHASSPREWRSLLSVLALSAVAWAAVVLGVEGGGVAGFVFAWTLMMVAMMLPSASPLVLLYRRASTPSATAALVAGYLFVWGAVGLAAWALHLVAMDVPAALVFLAAGVYQLTPIKSACLRRCRTPADFLVERWRPSAFVLGMDHGAWCLGCCWALMVVLVVAGMMGLAWVVALAALVAVEKLAPFGDIAAKLAGAGFIVLGVLEGVT